jgi:hypothetical protein
MVHAWIAVRELPRRKHPCRQPLLYIEAYLAELLMAVTERLELLSERLDAFAASREPAEEDDEE